MHLTGTELLNWIALRRVHEGGVARHGSAHVDWGLAVSATVLRPATLVPSTPPGTTKDTKRGGAAGIGENLQLRREDGEP